MSNKSRLQTNNTNLQALINKANALPDAGSGGSLETCTGTLSIPSDVPLADPVMVYYIDSDLQLKVIPFAAGETFSCLKNSILYIQNWTAMSDVSGSLEYIDYYMGRATYYVSGNFDLIYRI